MTNSFKIIFFSLFFLIFFYLSNFFILSDLTDSNSPLKFLHIHYWHHDQYLINYRELGFVKRGLIGSIFNTNFENYIFISKLYSFLIVILIAYLYSKIILKFENQKNIFYFLILFGVSPFFFQNLGYEFARLDQVGILFSVLVCYLIIEKKNILLVEIIAPILILVHEQVFFTFVNFLIFVQFLIQRPLINKIYVIFFSFFIMGALFLFGGIDHETYLLTKDKYKFIDIYFLRGPIESTLVFWPEMLYLDNYQTLLRHLFSIIVYVISIFYFYKIININYNSFFYIITFTVLFVIPTDHSRSLYLFLILMVLIFLINSKTKKTSLNFPKIKFRYFLIMFLGPIGTSAAFPILGVIKRIIL